MFSDIQYELSEYIDYDKWLIYNVPRHGSIMGKEEWKGVIEPGQTDFRIPITVNMQKLDMHSCMLKIAPDIAFVTICATYRQFQDIETRKALALAQEFILQCPADWL
eukprot:357794-Chlamydomonas_euryale.AAC.2